jgi:hypothetical protein
MKRENINDMDHKMKIKENEKVWIINSNGIIGNLESSWYPTRYKLLDIKKLELKNVEEIDLKNIRIEEIEELE